MTRFTEREFAAVLHGPRDVRLEEVDRPRPGPGQVLVQIERVGLCGTDLNYYVDGFNGPTVLSAPTVLGHEASGIVVGVGEGTPPRLLGRQVALEPATSCGVCLICRSGRSNLCPSGFCLGSPPTNGALREHVVIEHRLAHPLPERLNPEEGVLIEPLAVGCWAVHRARVATGHRVLVTGAGPIGLLTAKAALAAGALEVTVADVHPQRLELARRLHPGPVVDLGTDELPGASIDRMLECSGAATALEAVESLKPGGVIALVGVPQRWPAAPLGYVQRWEVDLVGCFRYGPAAFRSAIGWSGTGRVRLSGLVTARFSLAHTGQAIETALTDRTQLKVVVQPNAA
ncbi:alcohol dehydrogenase catalytic domain-containing protein [Allokutzneria multivorans]